MSRTRSNSYTHRALRRRRDVEEFPVILETVGALEKAVGHRVIFTRDVLQQAADNLAKARDPNYKEEFTNTHVLGGTRAVIWPAGRNGDGVHINWRSSWRLQEQQGKTPLYHFSKIGFASVTDDYGLRPDDHATNPLRLRIDKLPPPIEQLGEMAKLAQQLMQHRVWRTMQKVLSALPVKVNNIVCLAMGAPTWACYGTRRLSTRSCAQHIMACCIAQYLTSRYGNSRDIPIVAYDPAYDVADVHLLSSLPHSITVVSDPYQYLSITPNTLVMSICAPQLIPITEIIADSLFPSGPAAMITTELHWQPWHENGLNALINQRVPRVATMLELYEEPLWFGNEVVRKGEGADEALSWLKYFVYYARKA